MDLFAVPDHHKIVPREEMTEPPISVGRDRLGDGIWCYDKRWKEEGKKVLHITFNQCKDSPIIQNALFALRSIEFPGPKHHAVVSLEWCNAARVLYVPKRVWLSVYCGKHHVFNLSHDPEPPHHAFYRFSALWSKEIPTEDEFKALFTEKIRGHWQIQKENALANKESADATVAQANSILAS